MSLERDYSFKRTNEDSSSSAPKRNSSPRNPLLYVSPPSTPKKIKHSNSGRKLITSFKNFYSSSKSVFVSPVSDIESVRETDCFFSPNSSINLPLSPSGDNYESDKSSLSSADNSMNEEFQFRLSNLSLQYKATHQIFTIPEILSKIISYVDDYTLLPHEESPVRRRPLSYQHALLIYKDEKKAKRIWKQSMKSQIENSGNPETVVGHSNTLYNCLLVNRLWYEITREVVTTKHYFANDSSWLNFVRLNASKSHTLVRSKSNTKLFIMHKLTKAKQEDVDLVSKAISGNLEWIEMYICPKVLPTPLMLSGSLLKKLILPGSKVVNDSFLSLVSNNCPKLQVLDLRACSLVSDHGIIDIASKCPDLKLLNLGRHSRSEYITDRSISMIAKNTSIETVGLAGCAITDRSIWELALQCSDSLTRLSLNNCKFLTNDSIPRIISYGFLNKLSVLEIRHITNLTNVTPLIEFKRYKSRIGSTVLIEGCEILEQRMKEEEWKLDMKASAKMLNDILHWVNIEEDGDIPHLKLMKLLHNK